jgi:spore germination protein GerM
MAGVLALVVALGLVLWTQHERLFKPSSPQAPTLQVDRDKPILIKVFFGAPGRQRLEAEARTIYASATKADQAKQALLEILKGPRSGLVAVVPQATAVKELYLAEDGTAYVDLSKEASSGHPGGVLAERLTVAAVVNTLLYNFPEITRVRLFIEGEPRETLSGHVRISGLLGRDREMVARP